MSIKPESRFEVLKKAYNDLVAELKEQTTMVEVWMAANDAKDEHIQELETQLADLRQQLKTRVA